MFIFCLSSDVVDSFRKATKISRKEYKLKSSKPAFMKETWTVLSLNKVEKILGKKEMDEIKKRNKKDGNMSKLRYSVF